MYDILDTYFMEVVYMGPYHFWAGGMWIFPLIGMIFMFTFLFLIFRHKSGNNSFCSPFHHSHSNNDGNLESAIEILKKRYAKGEITKEEYERIKKDIIS